MDNKLGHQSALQKYPSAIFYEAMVMKTDHFVYGFVIILPVQQ
jgi:hypothetical protein